VCYGTLLLLSDLTPTIGLWQTVFVALFDRYRNLFLILFHGHFVSYLIPLGIRFRCDTDQTRPEAPPRPPVLPIADCIDSRFTCPPVCLCVLPGSSPCTWRRSSCSSQVSSRRAFYLIYCCHEPCVRCSKFLAACVSVGVSDTMTSLGLRDRYPCTADLGVGISLLSVHDKVTAGVCKPARAPQCCSPPCADRRSALGACGAEMRHKWLLAMLFSWSHVQTEFALDAWLMQGSANSNFYYFSSLLGLIAQIGTITTAFAGALTLEERCEQRSKAQ
jgi:hypothetical protein